MEQCTSLMVELSTTCAGPRGVPTVFVQGDDGGVVKSVLVIQGALTLCQRIQSTNDALLWRWMLAQVRAHVSTCEDGGWLLGFLMSDIVIGISRLEVYVEPTSVSMALGTVQGWLAEYFEARHASVNCIRDVKAADLPIAAYTMLHSVQDSTLRWRIASLVVDACGSVNIDGKLYPQRVLVDVGNVQECTLRQGFWVRRPMAGAIPTTPACVLLLAFSVDDDDVAVWESLLVAAQRCQAQVIASQRVLGPTIQQLLVRAGLACVERLSIHHVHSVRIISAATLLSSPEQLHQVESDSCGRCFVQSSSHGTLFESAEKSAVVTISIPSTGEAGADNLIRLQIQSCVRCLCRLYASLLVVPGGGQYELVCAEYLRERASRTSNVLVQQVSILVANSLARFAVYVLGGPPSSGCQVHGDMFVAVNDVIGNVKGTSGEVLDSPPVITRFYCNSPLLDIWTTKRAALLGGIDAAATLLRMGFL